MIYRKGTKGYELQLARWLRTKDGTALALFIIDQLVTELETDRRGHFTRVELDGDTSIVLPVTD